MKAISLTQPWATLVAIGAKQIETRSWKTAYRGPLAIHAAKRFPKSARYLFGDKWAFHTALRDGGYERTSDLPLGAVIATCRLVGCKRISSSKSLGVCPPRTWMAQPEEPELSFGDYTPGRYAWILDDINALPKPIPAKGALGLWEWELDQNPANAQMDS